MNTAPKTVFFYITDNGRSLAERLKALYPDSAVRRFEAKAVGELWDESDTLAFIMAAGIVVRTISPLVRDKKSDPAVLVLDEKGKFCVSLLSGHLGGANDRAREVAAFLGGEAVITTASDVNNMPSLDLWAVEQGLAIEDWNLLPGLGTRLIDNGTLRVYTERELPLPGAFLRVADPRSADLLITARADVYRDAPVEGAEGTAVPMPIKDQLYLRPKSLIIGMGCNSGTSAGEIEEVVTTTLASHNLSPLSLTAVATIDLKAQEPGIKTFVEKFGYGLVSFTPDELNAVEGVAPSSEAVLKATGAYAVSEPAARLAAGTETLLVAKQKKGNVTVAVAEKGSLQAGTKGNGRAAKKAVPAPSPSGSAAASSRKGKVFVVGTGPGGVEYITPYAQEIIRTADAIAGYGTYLELIEELIKGKEVFTTGMTGEVDRCRHAIDVARTGKTVAVISGGDPGIYAMAGLVFELLRAAAPAGPDASAPDVEVVPGISALNACASRLGAPLMHDFAAISLSDRLTPWELIEKRLAAAASADFVIALYNPKSLGRPEHINTARAVCLKHRSAETPVGIVKGATRENERVIITNLRDMLNHDIDMQTTVIIGNSHTFTWGRWMITPRGYEEKGKY